MSTLQRSWRLFALGPRFLGGLVRGSFEVSRLVARPGMGDAAVLRVELETDDPWVITAFANLLTLTPGTLALDVSDDHSAIYVHVMTTRSLDEVRGDMRSLQRQLLRVAR